MAVNREQAKRAVADLLSALGHDPAHEPGLAQTPELVVESWMTDWLSGYTANLQQLLAGAIDAPGPNAPIVTVSDISVCTLCPHHLLPAEGTATVAYLPGAQLLGLGTLARLVEAFSRRLTLQEQIGENVVAALVEHAGARGAYCQLQLHHACLRLRGAKQANATVTTNHYAGSFCSDEGRARLYAELPKGQPS